METKKPYSEKEDEELKKFLEKIQERNTKEAIYSRLGGRSFCQTILFCSGRFRKEQSVSARDLSEFLRVSYSRGYEILREMESFGLVNKSTFGQFKYHVTFIPIKNSEHPKIFKYEKVALKNLGWVEK